MLMIVETGRELPAGRDTRRRAMITMECRAGAAAGDLPRVAAGDEFSNLLVLACSARKF